MPITYPRRVVSTPTSVQVVSSATPTWVTALTLLTWTELASTQTHAAWLQANTGQTPTYRGVDIWTVLNHYTEWVPDAPNKVFYHLGGGHAASSNNTVTKFDPRTLQYSIAVAPTPTSKYPPAFVEPNSPIVYPSGFSCGYFASTADLTNPLDTAYALPERQRAASHAYGAFGFWNGRMLTHYGTFGGANVNTGKWELTTNANPYGPQILAGNWGYGNAPFQPNSDCAVDWNTGFQWIYSPPGDVGDNWRSRLHKVNPDTQIILTGEWTGQQSLVFTTSTKIYTVYPNTYNGPFGKLDRFNPTTGLKEATITMSGVQVPAVSGTTMERVPICNDDTYLYMWHYNADRYALFRVRISDGVADRIALGGAGMPNSEFRYKLAYIKDWAVIMVQPHANAKWWAVRLA